MEVSDNERRNFGKGNAKDEVQCSVRNALLKFQNGYTKRDISLLDSFIEDLFSDESDALVVGTGDGEWCMGKKEIRELIEIDWEYWGELALDIDGAILSSYGDVAWLTTEGELRKIVKEDKLYDNCIKKIKENLDCEGESKNKLMHTLKTVSTYLYEGNLGEEIIRPIRLSAILIKKNDTWKFHNLHFSYPVAPPTDLRIIGNHKIS